VAKIIRRGGISKPLDSAKAARQWLARGILPVPIKPGTKKPNGGKGWNSLRATTETIDHFFKPGFNIGGLWGEPSNWIVDIDLDWDEAADIAKLIMPETFTYGRGARPGTHLLYQCEVVAGSKRYAPKEKDKQESDSDPKKIIVEIRSTGSQSLLPPSILSPEVSGQPHGDRYIIENDADFTSISARHLEELVNHVAAAAILIRNYPNSGARHDYIHAVTGSLLWGGWPEDKARKLSHAILSCCEDRESDPKQRSRTIDNTIEHFRKGNRISGWKTLSQWLSGDSLKLVREWLTLKEKMAEVPAELGRRILNRPIEPKLLKPPGLVGEIAEWSARASYLKQPIFDVAVGIMCTALIGMNKYVIDGWETPIQPYLMLLAPTSAGKESALDNMYHFTKRAGIHEYSFMGFQSYHAMLDKLAEPPHMACWLWDEAARRLKSAHKSVASQDFQVLTHLIGMYGKANKSVPGVPGRHTSIPPLDNPFMTVAAAAQPDQLLEAITDSDVSTGLINRFILFDVGDRVPDPNLRRDNLFPAKIDERIRTMKRIQKPQNGWIRVRMEDTQVFSRFRDFDHEARQHAFGGGGGELWGRANQNALILAGVLAIGINPRAPVITRELVDWALDFMRWSCRRWEIRVDDSSARTWVEKRSKGVERIIREPMKQVNARTSAKYLKLMERGLIPRGIIARACRHLTARDLEDTLNQLTAADLIACGDEGGIEVFWSKQ
jgi:Bifunctional DNA primase/polymerase, N-terminal